MLKTRNKRIPIRNRNVTTSTLAASPWRIIDAARVSAAAEDAHADDNAIACPRNPSSRFTRSTSACGRDSAISEESPCKIARSTYSISPTVDARISGVIGSSLPAMGDRIRRIAASARDSPG